MRRREAQITYYAGTYYVHEYWTKEQISSGKDFYGACYRARKKGFRVMLHGTMFECGKVLKPLR